MAVTSGYFNSVNGDRKYNADQMSEYFEGIINEGVCQHIGGGLAVTAGTGLSVVVATGKAFIGQKWLKNDAALTLTISAASESYSRIDAVVIRKNNAVRSCQIAVKVGTPAASPVAPTMTRDSTTYEMALAYVNVSAGASSVTVTDKRSDTTVCGWATVAQETSGEVDAMLNAMKTGFDGYSYNSPAAAVTGQVSDIYKVIESYVDELNKNTIYNGNIFQFYIKKIEGYKCNDYNGRLYPTSQANNNFYIIPIKKNTTYNVNLRASRIILLKSDMQTIDGDYIMNASSFTNTDDYFMAISFNVSQYPESTAIISESSSSAFIPGNIVLKYLKLEEQPYMSYNMLQVGWEVGDISSNTGANISGSTTLRTVGYCPVFGGEQYTAVCHGSFSPMGFVYQYSAEKTYLGSSKLITMQNGIAFTTDANAAYVRIVISSTYGTTDNGDIVMYQKGGIVRNLYDLMARISHNEGVVPSIVVAKDGSGNYTSLTAAVNSAVDGDVIYVKAGTYENEQVEAWGKKITIIGDSPYNTIITNDTDVYATPPIEMAKGAIYNIQFLATGVRQDEGWHAYALHIDNDSQLNETFYAENCIFDANMNSAIGAGMRRNSKMVFRNCKFISHNAAAVFLNESTEQQGGGITNTQRYEFYNCSFKTDTNGMVVRAAGMKSTGTTVYCTFFHCCFQDDGTTNAPVFRMNYSAEANLGTSTTMGDMGIINWNYDSISDGNSIAAMNKVKAGTVTIVE